MDKKNKKQKVYKSVNLKQTKKIAKRFASSLNGGEIVLLLGEVGAGKTVFAREVIKKLGYKGVVSSPTFSIMQQYFGRKFAIYHFDLYRIESVEESYNFGLDEFLFNRDINTVVLIEWPERVASILKGDFVVVTINKTDDLGREIMFNYQEF